MSEKKLTFIFSTTKLFWLSLLLTCSYIYPLTIGSKSILLSDYGKFYHSQTLLIVGKNIYAPIFFDKKKGRTHSSQKASRSTAQPRPMRLADNLNPPFFTLVTFPLAYLSYEHALLLWTFLSILAGGWAVLLIQKTLILKIGLSFNAYLWLLIAFFSYFPTFATLQFGQVSLLLLPLTVLSWRAARTQKYVKSAIFLALLANLKPFFGLFILYFLSRKQWRAVGTWLATSVACVLVSSMLLGKFIYLSYYQACQHLSWAASSWNVSLYGFLLRLVGGTESNLPVIALPSLFFVSYFGLGSLILFATIRFLIREQQQAISNKTDLDFSIILLAMLLLSPLGWLYYFPLLSLPFLALWKFAEQDFLPTTWLLLLALFLLLSNIPISLIPSSQIKDNNVFSVFLASTIFFSILLSWFMVLFFVQQYNPKKTMVSFETMPPTLLSLVCVVAFLPSVIGIFKASLGWLSHAEHYYRTTYMLIY